MTNETFAYGDRVETPLRLFDLLSTEESRRSLHERARSDGLMYLFIGSSASTYAQVHYWTTTRKNKKPSFDTVLLTSLSQNLGMTGKQSSTRNHVLDYGNASDFDAFSVRWRKVEVVDSD
jgi:hypothetical protein